MVISAGRADQFPPLPLGHVVFSGRSNVGKSSVINCLLNRKNFARTSATPGKTATINFFNLDERLLLVDLPGYGFANVSKARKDEWGRLIEAYLNGSENIGLLVQLVDARHKPTADDKLMLSWIREMEIPFVVVCTKCDKLSKKAAKESLESIRAVLDLDEEDRAILFSNVTKEGRETLLKWMEEATAK